MNALMNLSKTNDAMQGSIARLSSGLRINSASDDPAGLIISEGNFTVCGLKVGVGSFGLGHTKPAATSNEDMKLTLYDQAGDKLSEYAGKKDADLAQPKPLQVVAAQGQPAKLYLGRYAFDLQ